MPNFLTSLNLALGIIRKDGKKSMIEYSNLILGGLHLCGENVLSHLNIVNIFSRFLPKEDFISIFLCYCKVLSLFKNTLVRNSELGTAIQE